MANISRITVWNQKSRTKALDQEEHMPRHFRILIYAGQVRLCETIQASHYKCIIDVHWYREEHTQGTMTAPQPHRAVIRLLLSTITSHRPYPRVPPTPPGTSGPSRQTRSPPHNLYRLLGTSSQHFLSVMCRPLIHGDFGSGTAVEYARPATSDL